jgi:hypothetical protein
LPEKVAGNIPLTDKPTEMQCEWLMDNYTMLPESREQVIMIIV